MVSLNNADARQVPKVIKICADKKYHDILYSYLQDISEWDCVQGHPRHIAKKSINFSNIATILSLSRQTVSTKFKNLMAIGLVKEKDKDTYELEILPKEVAALIPHKTLRLLVDTLSENSISTYIYLLMRYFANKEKGYKFTLSDIKKHIGICTTTRSNDETIINILFVLQKIGLIKYNLTTSANEITGDVKTMYELAYITNYIEC